MNLHKELSAPELYILQTKLDTFLAKWDEQFDKFTAKQGLIAAQSSADDLTIEAQEKLSSLQSILAHTLAIDDRVDWEALKDHTQYEMPKAFPESAPTTKAVPQPDYSQPKVGFFDVLLGRKARLLAEAEAEYDGTIAEWNVAETKRQSNFEALTRAFEKRKVAFWEKHMLEEKLFDARRAAQHLEVEKLKQAVVDGEEQAVIEHVSLVLDASNYNDLFEKSYLAQYDREQKLLKLAYDLPSPDVMPTIKQVRFIKSTGELKETHISEREKKTNFESAGYQVCLRTIHELFEADENNNYDRILFNGFVTFIDPASGQELRSCLLSILVDKPTFLALDLSRIDPKTCFKSLKGVSAGSLASLASIAPVMELDTEDRRFIDARAVAAEIDESTNLATISWEDFEHLVREVFGHEFASRGGEVKVTQSSSDGGVDAVAFDPDPITGGKIVIQAKRYTRTVGVGAVRDLYGTLMNEGASRGILVTTSDFGPDAYNFANGKPLTLMTGQNLLHLMERHGFNARIDLREAREMMAKQGLDLQK